MLWKPIDGNDDKYDDDDYDNDDDYDDDVDDDNEAEHAWVTRLRNALNALGSSNTRCRYSAGHYLLDQSHY